MDVKVTIAPLISRLQADANGLPQIIQTLSPAAGTTPATRTATTDSSGRAVFRDLVEGNYTVLARRDGYFGIFNDTFPAQANARVQVGPSQAPTAAGATPVGRGAVVPSRQPVQQITLNLVQGSTISGRILDANRRPASAVQVGAYRVTYQLGHRVLTQVGTAVQSDDRGEYRLFWYPPGEYYIHTGGARVAFALPGGTSYPSVTYYPGTQDPRSAAPLVVGEGNALSGIDISIPAASGITVSGTIVNTIPGGRATKITLIPDPPRGGNLLLYESAMSTAMGTFTLNCVAPGTYKLFAWEQIPTGAEEDPDFMREYDLLGTSVNVTAGLTQSNIQLTPIPAKH